MRAHHVFRPTAFDSLEDRVVMATTASAVSGLSLGDVLLVNEAVNTAFSQFQFDISSGLNSLDFPNSPTTTNPLVAPSLSNFQSTANDRVVQLAVQLSDTLSPLRGSTKTLVPTVLALTAGPGPGSLSDSLNSTINQLNTAINITQGPNTNDTQNAAIQQATANISAYQTQISNQIQAARLAVINGVNLFANTPQGRVSVRRAQLNLTAAQNLIAPAYNSFRSGLAAAVAQLPTTPTDTTFPGNINTLRASVINLTNTLSTQLSSGITSALGSTAAGTRISAYVRSQINGLDSGSLLNNLQDEIGTLTLPATGGTFSTSAFTFGTNNLISQSSLATAGLLVIGTR